MRLKRNSLKRIWIDSNVRDDIDDLDFTYVYSFRCFFVAKHGDST